MGLLLSLGWRRVQEEVHPGLLYCRMCRCTTNSKKFECQRCRSKVPWLCFVFQVYYLHWNLILLCDWSISILWSVRGGDHVNLYVLGKVVTEWLAHKCGKCGVRYQGYYSFTLPSISVRGRGNMNLERVPSDTLPAAANTGPSICAYGIHELNGIK